MLRALRTVVTQPHLLLASVGVVLVVVATGEICRQTEENANHAEEHVKHIAQLAEENAENHRKIREIIDRLQKKFE